MLNRKILSYFGLRPTGDFGPWTFYTSKRGTPVWFIKAPPKEPPTARQIFIRTKFSDIARAWTKLTQETKINWEKASKKAQLGMTGYNLFQWWWWHQDRTVMETIERQAGIQLID